MVDLKDMVFWVVAEFQWVLAIHGVFFDGVATDSGLRRIEERRERGCGDERSREEQGGD